MIIHLIKSKIYRFKKINNKEQKRVLKSIFYCGPAKNYDVSCEAPENITCKKCLKIFKAIKVKKLMR